MHEVWCDVVDVIHGQALLFTVWLKEGGEYKRVYSGYDIDVAASYERKVN